MKTTRILLIVLYNMFICGILQAQYLPVTYSTDSLQGEIHVSKADYISGQERVWEFKLPENCVIKVTRINHVNLPYAGEIFVDTTEEILSTNKTMGEYSETISNKHELHFVLNFGHETSPLYTEKEHLITIKFAKVMNNGSGTLLHDGDLELSTGVLRAYGYEDFMGSKVAAVLGGDYASYTTFGAFNGGRIRGSNEGYLILEGNPNGYGNPTVYINRYTSSGNVIMTSYSGKVGIGTDYPSEKLHIEGAIRGDGVGGALRIKTQYGILEVGAQDNFASYFVTNKPKFIFNKGVDIQGSILATEVKIKSIDDFPDYVFEKNYTLRPLSEVQQFISDNGHLPEIPSAQEVKTNGISLVEMNVKLLQKVEELTLYAIQQQKEIQKLQAEIQKLK